MYKFQGEWIADGCFSEIDDRTDPARNEELKNSHVLFRSAFEWDGKSKVRLYYSADDYAKVYVNGTFVSQGPAPGYTHRTYYLQKDISGALKKGKNILAFHVYYQGLVNRVWVSGNLLCGLIFDVVAGGKLLARSCETVKTARHTGYTGLAVTGYDTQFMERYDSRAPEVGFENPSYDDGRWEYAKIRKYAPYRLYPQRIKQLDAEELIPVRLPGRSVYDFRREFAGNPSLTAQGKAGDRIEIRLGEELNGDGSVRWQMRCNCEYREEWILSGNTDVFVPFDYKAFRYMELIYPSTVRILRVGGTARHYPFRLRAKISLDDEALKKLFDLCVNTLKYGIQEGYLDCPSREKGQYFGDGVWSALTHIALTGDTSLYKKFIENAFDSMVVDAGMTAQGPCAYVQTIAEFPLYIVLSLKWYLGMTGDKKFTDGKRADVIRLLQVYKERYFDEQSGLICVYDRWNVVDWPASARDGYDFRLEQNEVIYGFHNVMCGYWLFALKACRELYGEEIVDISAAENAYRKAFYDEASHTFKDSVGSAHTALASQLFGVLSSVTEDADAGRILLEMIEEKRLTKSNLFITPFMFLWLKKTGREVLLRDLIKDKDAWLNMLAEGATTTFEAFSKDKKENASLFHTMFSFPALFLAYGTERDGRRLPVKESLCRCERFEADTTISFRRQIMSTKKIVSTCLAACVAMSLGGCVTGGGEDSSVRVDPNATVNTYINNDAEYLTFGDLAYDVMDDSVLQMYLDCGFNVYAITEDWAGAITDGTSNDGGLTDRYKERLQQLTDKGVNTWIRNQYNDPDYVENDDADKERYNFGTDYKLPVRDLGPDDFDEYSVSGFFLCDEPAMYTYTSGTKRMNHGMSEYTKLVDWYNKYYSDSGKFFHMNLFPVYTSMNNFVNPDDPTDSVSYEEYVDYYVENFAKKINGPKSICVDNYPFQNVGAIRSSYYENLLLFANKTRDCNKTIQNEDYKAKLGICIQSFTESGLCDITCAEDISFQLCVGIALGTEVFHFFAYKSYGSISGIMSSISTGRIYDYVQQANLAYFPFATVTSDFSWQGAAAVQATEEANRENGSFSNLTGAISVSEMGDLKGVTSSRDSLVGYFTHKESGQPGYMIANCTLPSGGQTASVTLDFGSHERVFIYTKSTDGKTLNAEEMNTIGGKLRLSVGAGEGVFVVPA